MTTTSESRRGASTLPAEEFEREVLERLRQTGNLLHAFRVSHRERLEGHDGTYEIDIVARFQSLGVDFTVLVECKAHKNPIKREVVQILYDKVRSTGAHKAIIFSTGPYQKGAVEYAIAHGIALFWVSEGEPIGPIARSSGRFDPPSDEKLRAIFAARSRRYDLLLLSNDGDPKLVGLSPDELRALLGSSDHS